jgi:hypothetical protein
MKEKLGIDKSKKKNNFGIMELKKVMASELIADINLVKRKADCYEQCKLISDNASYLVNQATNNNQLDYAS